MSTAPSDRLLTGAILLGLAVAAGLSVAAFTTGLILYADGAFFSFLVGIQESWSQVWYLMPARVAVYLLTVLPAETARGWGLPAPAAMRLYQALFIGLPFFGLAACLVPLPREARWLLLFPVLSLLALTVSALGYPSETMLTLAAFWPALYGWRFARGRIGPALVTLAATAAFVFSHPGMVFGLPLLALAAALRFREAPERRIRQELLLLGVATTVLLVLWAWRLAIEMSDPRFVQVGQRMWSLAGLVEVARLQPAILVVLLYILLWAALAWRRDGATPWAAWLGFPAVATLFTLLHAEVVTPESHYYVRTALVLLLPLLGALALWSGRIAPSGATTLAMVVALAATQLSHDVAFIRAWLNYRDGIRASVADAAPRIVTLEQALAARPDPAGAALVWSWGQPYLSLTLPGFDRYAAIVAAAPGAYSPFRCSQMGLVTARADWVPPETLAALQTHVCSERPK